MSTPREEVYRAINSERAYQDFRWTPQARTLDEFALYIRQYSEELADLAAHSDEPKPKLDIVRKVAALCVACMEQHGAVLRGDPIFANPTDALASRRSDDQPKGRTNPRVVLVENPRLEIQCADDGVWLYVENGCINIPSFFNSNLIFDRAIRKWAERYADLNSPVKGHPCTDPACGCKTKAGDMRSNGELPVIDAEVIP